MTEEKTKIVTADWIEARWRVQAYWKRDILRQAKEQNRQIKIEIGYDITGSYIRRMELV